VRRYGLERRDFEAVLDALERDIEADEATGARDGGGEPAAMFETVEALERYCAGVASAVGVICVRVWGWESWAGWERVRELASRRGLAFQLTNVLRDVGEDASVGRCYVPGEVLGSHGLTAGSFCAWEDPARCVGVVVELAGEAASHFERSAELDRMVSRDGAATLWAMTRIYRGVLSRVERDPAVVLERGGARLSGFRKACIAARAAARASLGVR
jgi:phytoene synthase